MSIKRRQQARESHMRKKGGLLAVIAGLYGALAAIITLIVVGGIGAAARIGDVVVWLGWGGVVSSLVTIVLGTICIITTSTRPALLLVFSALVGAVLVITPVSIFLAIAFIGGLLALLGGVSKPPPPASPTTIDSPNIQKDDPPSADFWLQPLQDALAELDNASTLAPGNHDFMVGKIEKAKRARVLFLAKHWERYRWSRKSPQSQAQASVEAPSKACSKAAWQPSILPPKM